MTDERDLIEEALSELDAEPAPQWEWRELGDTIAGVVTGYRKEHGRVRAEDESIKSRTTIVYELSTPDGPRRVWASPVVLRTELCRARIGDAVAIRCLGPARTADVQRIFEVFSVVVRTPPDETSGAV